MIIIPAIDIMDGECVRLTKGEFSTRKIYSADPLAMARKFETEGTKMLHLVDLDAAKTGKPVNQALIIKISSALNIPVEVGGGIRNIATARKYLNSNIERIIIGTQAITEPQMVSALIKEFGSRRIVVALEVKRGKIAVNGWQKTSAKKYLDFAKELRALGVTEILFTDVEKDGSLTGPNFAVAQELISLGFNVTVSGGVADLASISKLKILEASGVILGKALYENKINLTDALSADKPLSNLTKRIIPCLDVKDGKVVKGVKFKAHAVVGEIVDFAKRYSAEGADELVFYDITASTEGRTISADWIKRVAEVINIPFCVAGGIKSVEDARKILQSGADKISINSPAVENPELISQLAMEFGSQAIVVGIDSLEKDSRYFVKQYSGDPAKIKSTKWLTFDWALEAQKRGAGEIVLNCMNQDGVRRGYNVGQLKKLRQLLTIPLVASGGAGSMKDFSDVFLAADVDAALAASVFHNGAINIGKLKKYLLANNIAVRK